MICSHMLIKQAIISAAHELMHTHKSNQAGAKGKKDTVPWGEAAAAKPPGATNGSGDAGGDWCAPARPFLGSSR
jgi:hypothetical protein